MLKMCYFLPKIKIKAKIYVLEQKKKKNKKGDKIWGE